MGAGGLAREALDFLTACAVVAIIGISLFLDINRAFGLGVVDAIAICLAAFLAHDLAHKLCAKHMARGGRFRLAITGSLFSLFVTGIQHLMGFAMLFVGLSTGEPLRLAPYRFLAPGTVVVRGKKKRSVLGRVALAGPVSNVMLGWLMFFLGLSSSGWASELLLIGSALNAYVAATALLPLAFCDGLTIYWWSRRAFFSVLMSTVALITASNLFLFTSSG